MYAVDRTSLKRAAFFAPVSGNERIAFWIYQIFTVLLIIILCILEIGTSQPWFYLGSAVCLVGMAVMILSVVSFTHPDSNGINMNGIYRISRNPMYISFFIYFLGCVLLTQSILLLAVLIVFQISAHWIILSEERWCKKEFGEIYIQYSQKVRRYL